jgi:type I restriction enzyme S subunit
LEEQKKIVSFLDFRVKKIDELISKKKIMVDKLRERRISAIAEAVLKGLNRNLPMKNSDVDWIGLIPSHWNIRPLKYSFNILNNRRVPLSSEERSGMPKNYPYYGASGVIDMVEGYIFDEPTVLIGEDGANLLSRSTPLAFEATGKYWVNNHAHILSPVEGPFSYWSNLLCTVQYDPWITGSAQPKLTKENLGKVLLPQPPLDEQYQIADYISKIIDEIDPLIEATIQTIDRLKEYKKKLITDVTTGQIDVRKIDIPQE